MRDEKSMAFDNYYVYQSAAYEWIDRFLKNCDFSHGSNSQICADTAEADTGVMGFFVYNKTRKLEKEQMQRALLIITGLVQKTSKVIFRQFQARHILLTRKEIK